MSINSILLQQVEELEEELRRVSGLLTHVTNRHADSLAREKVLNEDNRRMRKELLDAAERIDRLESKGE